MIHVASRDSSGGSNQQSFIDVKFYACTSDAAVVAAIHRSIARLEQHYPIGRAAIAIHGGRRKTSIDLAVTLSDGQLAVATTSQPDPYAAVTDVFRLLQRRIVETTPQRVLPAAA